jgi:DNA-binding NarL/FixJ family response regulator
MTIEAAAVDSPRFASVSSGTILLVDDFEPWRRFVSSILNHESQLRIVCEAADGMDAVKKSEELGPDLVLLDLGLPTLNGIEAARQIRRLSPKTRILFVSQESSVDIVQEALSLGAWGYVVKSDAQMELLPAINAVLGGQKFVGSRFAGHSFWAS